MISGGHVNPAVSVGLWAGGRFPAGLLVPYIGVQVAGGIAGAAVLYLIASGRADFSLAAGFAANGYAEHSPGGYSLAAGLVSEIVIIRAAGGGDRVERPFLTPQSSNVSLSAF